MRTKPLVPSHRRTDALNRYYDHKASLAMLGLNCKGLPFQRTPNFVSIEDRVAAWRRRGLAAWQKRAGQFKAMGLTTRGTIRKNPVKKENQLQRVLIEIHGTTQKVFTPEDYVELKRGFENAD